MYVGMDFHFLKSAEYNILHTYTIFENKIYKIQQI
jgi:hypothetical protein